MSRGCRDWHTSRRALVGRAGEQLVPIPAAALEDGLEALERGGGLSRRDLFERGVAMWIAASGLAALASPQSVLEEAAAAQALDPNGPILVSLYLDGGNDGLNTLVPLTDPRYRQLRTRIGIPADQALPLPDTPDFGWHPALTGLKQLYDAGKVAVLPSVDYANPDQSHFNSAAYWRTGVVGATLDRTGWMGRALDLAGGGGNPLQAISASYGLDPVLLTKRAPVATVREPGDFDFSIPDVWDSEGFTSAYRAASRAGRTPARDGAASAYRDAFRMVDQLRPLKTSDDNPLPPVPVAYPDTDLGRTLRNLVRMLGAGFGTRYAAVSQGGGYDTHDNQPDKHAELLKDLGDGLLAFQADLAQRGLSQRVVTLVWSEFGRRPEDNDSKGTDHGAGGLVVVVGDRVNGGIRSEFPGLARLDEDDNLLVSTEFRTVYASLLEGWMGIEAARVLPGMDARRLPLIR